MKSNFFNQSVANIYSKPKLNSEISSQILYGEKFKILSKKKDWVKIKTSFDNYIGFIRNSKFNESFKPNNKINKLKSKIFKRINGKFLPTKNFLYFGSGISIKKKNKNFFEFEKNKWVKISDTKKIALLTEKNTSSMLTDLKNGRALELEHLNQYFIRRAEQYAVPCPINLDLVNTLTKASK